MNPKYSLPGSEARPCDFPVLLTMIMTTVGDFQVLAIIVTPRGVLVSISEANLFLVIQCPQIPLVFARLSLFNISLSTCIVSGNTETRETGDSEINKMHGLYQKCPVFRSSHTV